jgi:exosortase D (VPLPA-CTERM-specific)
LLNDVFLIKIYSKNMNTTGNNDFTFFSIKNLYVWFLWLLALIGLCITFRSGLQEMIYVWLNIEEYSHGIFIPCISIYFIWLRRNEFYLVTTIKESVAGLIIIIFGLMLFIVGVLSAIGDIELFAFLITFIGLFGTAFGLVGLKRAFVPLVFLVFMIPLPPFITSNLSSKLQLISSWLGVSFIRTCDILVFLEGNVIDLGGYKLQVVDACSGLRYLFPLSSLAFLCAYLFKGPLWQKTLIFLSSMPLTVFMNSFRIGVIGVLVNSWGTKMAEGFLHDFEGWAVFLLCLLLLFVEMWLLSAISGRNQPLSHLVQIPQEWGAIERTIPAARNLNKSIYLVIILLVTGEFLYEKYKFRQDIFPQRNVFLNFPAHIGNWQGRNDYIDKYYLDELKLTDYVIYNYSNLESKGNVNFYSAYYKSQRKGVGVHSPRSCIPGSGWQITLYEQVDLPEFVIDGEPLQVDRAVIEKGESKQLVYFWFQQRGRIITNEFMLKWYIFYDAINMNRTDGSLVRIVTDINSNEDISIADQRIKLFIKDLMPILPEYIPGKVYFN